MVIELSAEVSSDIERRRSLRKMKVVATGALLFAAAVYLFCRWVEHRDGLTVASWVGYLRAAAEAAMIGALADWFAVTALFRHPLGIPIPHTALIPKKKDQIGEQLGDFVKENFLTPEVISEKVQAMGLPLRFATWIAHPNNEERISIEVARAISLAAEMLDDEDIEQLIVAAIGWLAEPEWAPPAGRILEQLNVENRLAPVIQLACDRAYQWALNSGELIDRVIVNDGPSWSPKFVNALVGDKIYRELVDFVYKVKTDPTHDVRLSLQNFLVQFADELQHDEETIGRVEQIKTELLGRDEVAGAASTAWVAAKSIIEEALEDKNSRLRNTLTSALISVAERVRDDAALHTKMNMWTVRAANHIAVNYSSEIISIISETVRGWDAEETSAKLELQVGRDLQFIRINGTVVGALAGLAIYAVSDLIF